MRKGRVKYTERGFQQDAMEAMGGDIVRGLIELITNSDDAYESTGYEGTGRIEIEVNPKRKRAWKMIVRDWAGGMRAELMERKLTLLGGRTSGFEEGKNVRGNLGRGAKDLAAFGKVIFESISGGFYSKLTLQPDGNYTLAPEKNASPLIRGGLNIKKGGGTAVTVYVKAEVRSPQYQKLAEKLSNHYQLRDIVSSTRREVILIHSGTGEKTRIRYGSPALPVVKKREFAVNGYKDALVKLTIFRNKECCDEPPSNPYRPSGLLIKGKRAIYENTFFSLEKHPCCGWFSGVMECPYIDTLALEYDRHQAERRSPSRENPLPIISRRRDGLQKNHPFYKNLKQQVEEILSVLIKEQEQSLTNKGRESPAMRQALKRLETTIAKRLDRDLKDIEEEGLAGSGSGAEELSTLKIVPETVILHLEEERSITVYAPPALASKNFSVELDPTGVAEVVNPESSRFRKSKKGKKLAQASLCLRPLLEDEAILTVNCEEHSAAALLQVRPKRQTEIPPLEPPAQFKFERDIYRIPYSSRKKLTLMAPADFSLKPHFEASLSLTGEGVLLNDEVCLLRFSRKHGFYIGTVPVAAGAKEARVRVEASANGVSGRAAATCSLIVRKSDAGGPKIDIQLMDQEAGHRRALVERSGGDINIKIMCRHPVISRYFGPPPDYPNQEDPVCRLLLAEIIATEAARIIMEKRFEAQVGERLLDAASLYAEHFKLLNGYLRQAHESLLGSKTTILQEKSKASQA